MPAIFVSLLSESLQLSNMQIRNTVQLLQEGATIPFISRYRKERTGELDETQVSDIKTQYEKLLEIEKRKETILKSIEEQEKLTPELKTRIDNCWNATELEDIYLPYKPKRRTRAEIARENGLEPLAKMIMKQQAGDVLQFAKPFVKDKIESEEAALQGASDIIAEWISENEKARNTIRRIFQHESFISSKVIKGKEEEAQNYRDYFDMSEKLSRSSSHRVLAMRRGEAEGFLRVNISPDDDKCIERLTD
ncbi:MAG TPA: Tex-like N-terminal domain-containing protein, partial [Paludibacter sp.]|nr:Tex-like N-terminal domain-containing protein [Paludibacter sp.]